MAPLFFLLWRCRRCALSRFFPDHAPNPMIRKRETCCSLPPRCRKHATAIRCRERLSRSWARTSEAGSGITAAIMNGLGPGNLHGPCSPHVVHVLCPDCSWMTRQPELGRPRQIDGKRQEATRCLPSRQRPHPQIVPQFGDARPVFHVAVEIGRVDAPVFRAR